MKHRILATSPYASVQSKLKTLAQEYELVSVGGPGKALEALARNGPFHALVAQLQEISEAPPFLKRAASLQKALPAILIAGREGWPLALELINRGELFRLLPTPLKTEDLKGALAGAIEQNRLRRLAETFLEQTLPQTAEVMAEVLAAVSPNLFEPCLQARLYARALAEEMGLGEPWKLELAALLSLAGCSALPSRALAKLERGEVLIREEKAIWERHFDFGAAQVAKIPGLEEVAQLISQQRQDIRSSPRLPARLLRLTLDFARLLQQGHDAKEALRRLTLARDEYDPDVLEALRTLLGRRRFFKRLQIELKQLRAGMVLAQDVLAGSGMLLARRGVEVSETLCQRLERLETTVGIRQPLEVLVQITE